MRAPLPWATKNGSPPTPPNARTGLFTPPGITRPAASKRLLESRMSGLPAQRAQPRPLPQSARAEEGALEPAPAIGAHLDSHEIPLAIAPAEAGAGVRPAVYHRRPDTG